MTSIATGIGECLVSRWKEKESLQPGKNTFRNPSPEKRPGIKYLSPRTGDKGFGRVNRPEGRSTISTDERLAVRQRGKVVEVGKGPGG
jgi:hypothetical protein